MLVRPISGFVYPCGQDIEDTTGVIFCRKRRKILDDKIGRCFE
jgi:hypothetical protein